MHTPSLSEQSEKLPPVFTEVSTLNFAFRTKEPETIAEYRQRGLKPPNLKSFASNNNIIVVVDSDGIISAAIHENGDKYRLEELLLAEKRLRDMGYIDMGVSFYVPNFRKEEKLLN